MYLSRGRPRGASPQGVRRAMQVTKTNIVIHFVLTWFVTTYRSPGNPDSLNTQGGPSQEGGWLLGSRPGGVQARRIPFNRGAKITYLCVRHSDLGFLVLRCFAPYLVVLCCRFLFVHLGCLLGLNSTYCNM